MEFPLEAEPYYLCFLYVLCMCLSLPLVNIRWKNELKDPPYFLGFHEFSSGPNQILSGVLQYFQLFVDHSEWQSLHPRALLHPIIQLLSFMPTSLHQIKLKLRSEPTNNKELYNQLDGYIALLN